METAKAQNWAVESQGKKIVLLCIKTRGESKI
jgi:hypothetical protein